MNVGRVVIISDMQIPGVVVKTWPAYGTLSIRAITGVLYCRDLGEVTDAPDDVAAQVIADVKILSTRHADLSDALAAVTTDRAAAEETARRLNHLDMLAIADDALLTDVIAMYRRMPEHVPDAALAEAEAEADRRGLTV